ncbi:MAG TPA: GTP-binding protein, partial [Dongiaceae bacterium]|nr:GTP-binding protein [Dongiaceae bacterium]
VRPPVITVMGHVDHGKTKLLDYIRKANVVAGEAGGITQHIGAYDVTAPDGRKICFLDTPGHEAFTAMRARGAQVTDIVILVVAADDGVMPQTVEALNHAKAADVPIVVAINKIDREAANPDRVMQQLSEQGRGIVASLLVQQGTLRIGDAFVAGQHSGRVRAMYDERGRVVRVAGPSTPVEVVGWSGTPAAGDLFNAFEDEREARELAARRQAVAREQEFRAAKTISLSEIYSQISQGDVNELKMVIKGDVDGSVEALSEAFTKLSTTEVKVHVIRQAVGQITESDVLLAAASGAIIVGFHVRPDSRVRELAQREKIEIRLYDIIYKAVEDVRAALEGMLKPEEREVVLGAAEVRNVFKLSKSGTVAGCMVTSGAVPRTGSVRLLRDGVPIWTGRIGSLRRFKDDVKEVQSGFECGIALDGMNDVKVGDVIEAFKIESVARTLA